MLCTSLFLKRLMRGSKWIPAHTGKDGLFRLVRLAHSIYTKEVVTRIKSYHRFVTDFINSTQYHDENDAWSKNEHQKNYRTIAELLTNHEKIVRRHFDCDVLNEQTITNLLGEFYTYDLHELKVTDVSLTRSTNSQDCNIISLTDNNTLDLIVRLANEVNLFTEVLNVGEIIRKYQNNDFIPIISSNNTRLVLVLDRLAYHNIIPYNWQSLIERKKLILSSSLTKFLDKHNMASTLNRVKDMPLSPQYKRLLSIVDQYIQQIKDR